MKYIIALAVGLAIGSALMLAFGNRAEAQVTVTASVPCNEVNMGHSVLCMKDNRPVSGTVMGTEFYTIWINPELMLFWTQTAYWFVTPNGIVYD